MGLEQLVRHPLAALFGPRNSNYAVLYQYLIMNKGIVLFFRVQLWKLQKPTPVFDMIDFLWINLRALAVLKLGRNLLDIFLSSDLIQINTNWTN